MAGPLFLSVIVAVVLVAVFAVLGLPFLVLLPIFVVGLVLLGIGPLLRFIGERGRPGAADPSGVPTTRDASYDPVRDPTESKP